MFGSLSYCYNAVIQQVCCRYEDNGDAVNNLLVICKSTGNKSIEDFGSPDKWLQENAKLLGEDVWKGELCVQSGVANTVGPMIEQARQSSFWLLYHHSSFL